MDKKIMFDIFKQSIIQIATPYSTGTGFYISKFNLIITNEHVIRDNREVVINGDNFKKQIADIIYIDEKYDLAFIAPPAVHDMPEIELENIQTVVKEGEETIAVGHPYGMEYTLTKGIISNTQHQVSGVDYYQHDAALNPGNSGGPLISQQGKIIGMNTFIMKDGNSIGFSLPVKYILPMIEEFIAENRIPSTRCSTCLQFVFEKPKPGKYCPYCGTKLKMISQIDPYEAHGINRTIEEVLAELNYDVPISRMGPHNWSVVEGSAKINISYYEKSGLITGDAYLGILSKNDVLEIYTYLLRQNYSLEGIGFSVKGQDIILSLLIYDQYMDKEITKKLFKNFIQSADHFDNILVEEYGANWKKQ